MSTTGGGGGPHAEVHHGNTHRAIPCDKLKDIADFIREKFPDEAKAFDDVCMDADRPADTDQ